MEASKQKVSNIPTEEVIFVLAEHIKIFSGVKTNVHNIRHVPKEKCSIQNIFLCFSVHILNHKEFPIILDQVHGVRKADCGVRSIMRTVGSSEEGNPVVSYLSELIIILEGIAEHICSVTINIGEETTNS